MGIIFESVVWDLVVVAVVLGSALILYLDHKLQYWKRQGIPFIAPDTYFTDSFKFILGKQNIFQSHRDVYDKLGGNRFGGFFEIFLPTLVVKDPELVERILVKDFVHFYDRGFPSSPETDPLSQHLFNLEGEKWRHLRYKLTPTFTTGKLKGMFEQICNCGDNMIKAIDKESRMHTAFNPKNLFESFSSDVIASCAFGIKLEEDENSRREFREMVSVLVKPPPSMMIMFVLFLFFPKLAQLLRIKSVPQKLENFVMKLVVGTLKYREENNIKRNDFLQLMYNLQKREEAGEDLEDEQHDEDEVIDQIEHAAVSDVRPSQDKQKVFTNDCIAAQSFVFLLAGAESVSGSVGYILFCLSQHPDVQDKVHQEVKSVLADHNHKWSYQAVKEMTYLDQVIQEAQRLYPITAELQRICTEPYPVPNTNVVLEKGTRLIIPVMSIQNDPNNYTAPHVFDPERFTGNNFKPSGIFLPFGNGPRICIAMRFAVLEVKVCLARLMSEYSVTLNDKTKLPIEQEPNAFLLSPVGGFWFEFHKSKPQ